jgi:hypothetical protein
VGTEECKPFNLRAQFKDVILCSSPEIVISRTFLGNLNCLTGARPYSIVVPITGVRVLKLAYGPVDALNALPNHCGMLHEFPLTDTARHLSQSWTIHKFCEYVTSAYLKYMYNITIPTVENKPLSHYLIPIT